ncbi:MAG: ethanolamine utilization protein EutJ [Anaerolineales bacterium]|nr:ethanolamine utilization protein EutJ [Anaerolineales bacterium]
MERTLQALPRVHPPAGRMRVGVDLGTAYLVLVVLDEHGQPVTGEYQFARVVRDGVVVDYVGAVDRLSAMKQRVESSLGVELKQAFGSYPPGVPQAEVRAVANVIEAAGMLCSGLIDEPTAANALLGLENGVIVDVGGGTTGIAILSDGKVVYSSDEPTGGVHFSLVIAGAHDISFEEAEAMKIDPSQQERLFPTIRPVMEKVASIIARHLDFYQQGSGQSVDHIVLVGGTSKFPGIAGVIEDFTGIRTEAPAQPLFVTPIGIALHDHILV